MRYGIDLSSNNRHPIDFVAARAAGYDVAWIKLTQGVSYRNPFAYSDADAAKAAGFEVLLYHFAGGTNGHVFRAEDEADWFLTSVGTMQHDGLCLDYEPFADLTDSSWIKKFIDRSGSDMLYSYASRLNQVSWFVKSSVRLWVAAYQSFPPPGTWDAWQFSSAGRVPGIEGPVDVSEVYFAPPPALGQEIAPMYQPALVLRPIVADLPCPTGGVWLLGDDGGVYAFGGAPFYGAPAGQYYWQGRLPALLTPRADGQPGYTVWPTVVQSGESGYSYP